MRRETRIPQPTFSAAICDAAKRDAAAGRAGAARLSVSRVPFGRYRRAEHAADAAWRAIYSAAATGTSAQKFDDPARYRNPANAATLPPRQRSRTSRERIHYLLARF